MGMIAAIDADNYTGVVQMAVALQAKYRDRLGKVPAQRSLDLPSPGLEA